MLSFLNHSTCLSHDALLQFLGFLCLLDFVALFHRKVSIGSVMLSY